MLFVFAGVALGGRDFKEGISEKRLLHLPSPQSQQARDVVVSPAPAESSESGKRRRGVMLPTRTALSEGHTIEHLTIS